jgi:2-polyprenyl-3-methyl-5-hydroxy-6-metoxy-1,4-benzoquinol methylase
MTWDTGISEEYREVLIKKHRQTASWGTSVLVTTHQPLLQALIRKYHITSALDYGCGKGKLQLPIPLVKYDPGMPEFSHEPDKQDMVVCIDVLEHIEPDYLKSVLKNIKNLNRKGAFLSICTSKAHHLLPDGRNAHLIIENNAWWERRLKYYFNIVEVFPAKTQHYNVYVENKNGDISRRS